MSIISEIHELLPDNTNRAISEEDLRECFSKINVPIDELISWRNTLIGDDADNVINRISEIIALVNGIPEGTNLNDLINQNKPMYNDIFDI